MAEYRRALHQRIATVLSRMDPLFLERAQCYFGGGTQLVMSHGEFRESRDIDFLLSSADGLRMIRESIAERSLGALFKQPIYLAREVRKERDAIRTFIVEEERAQPIKFEIIVEGRIALEGAPDEMLRVPILSRKCAIAEKLLANADRGLAKEHRSRDVIDLAFVSLRVDDETFLAGYQLAQGAYGQSINRELGEVLKMLELDAGYRALCIKDLLVEDIKTLRKGLQRLHQLRRAAR
jgi:Nucleotidyl transferase AbiEii toxin, Type IV TA system